MAMETEVIALLERIARQGEAWKNGAPGAREGLMSTCSQIHSALILPAECITLTQWAQPTHSAVLRLGSEIQLFEALVADGGSPKSSQKIADNTNPQTEHSLVARMLRLLASMGTVRETGPDTFASTPLAEAMIREDFKDSVAFMHDDYELSHIKATEYFKDAGYKAPTSPFDTPFNYAYNCKGISMFEYFARSAPWMGKRFANMMQVYGEGRPMWFEEGYFPVRERLIQGAESSAGDEDRIFLVDVGGGAGHDVSRMMQAFGGEIPGKLVLQERREIVQIAEKELATEIVKMSHDFFTEQPVRGEHLCPSLHHLLPLILARRKGILPPLHHSRLARSLGPTNFALHYPGHETGLFQDFAQ